MNGRNNQPKATDLGKPANLEPAKRQLMALLAALGRQVVRSDCREAGGRT
jgi:hypothetical protein